MTINYYDKNAQSFYEGTVNANMDELYQPFLALLPAGASILDVGCGSGRDSLYFFRQGFKVKPLDGSEELVKLAATLIGQPVFHLSFAEINFVEEFDAIWACASLLHVPRSEIREIIEKLERALKVGGKFYCSFKYGNKEEVRDGRFFNYYNEISFEELIVCFSSLKVVKLWKSCDVRPGRGEEYWLNCILNKEF